MFTIKKDGKYVKDFTDGKEVTLNWDLMEKYLTKESAVAAAREYGQKNGKGYSVKEIQRVKLTGVEWNKAE